MVPNAPSGALEPAGMLLQVLGIREGCALQHGALRRGSFLQNLWGMQTPVCTKQEPVRELLPPGVVPRLTALLRAN